MIKIDQLKTLLDRDLDSKGVATLRRLVGKGEIEKISRQLVATQAGFDQLVREAGRGCGVPCGS